jgi:tRNA dimethylallyltransferase
MKPKVLVILGPTATGKSNLAVTLAKKFNGEVISADSRQVYKGMNLGTGKITKHEMQGVKHHMIDVVKPQTRFSVSQYQKNASKKIQDTIKNKKLPIIVGGTGFYIDSVTKNIKLPEVPPNKKLREKLEKHTPEKLFEKLKKLSPKRAKNIDKHNKVRLIRAIEIATELGDIPDIIEMASPYDFIFIGLDIANEILKSKIVARLEKRLKMGMVREVQKLHKSGVSWKRLESFGLEYKHITHYLQKKISKIQMIENLKNDIWHYVKRQRTWFKRNKNIKWFKPTEISKIIKETKNFLK